MGVVKVNKDSSGRMVVSFPYDPQLVARIKTIPGHRWHPAEKHRSFPSTDSTMEKILKVFEGEKVHTDPALQAPLSRAKRHSEFLKEPSPYSFEDLKRALLSREYSHKTIKGYIYKGRFCSYSPAQLRHPSARKRNGFAVYTGDTWTSA